MLGIQRNWIGVCIMLIYMDDMLIVGNTEAVDEAIQVPQQSFEVIDEAIQVIQQSYMR